MKTFITLTTIKDNLIAIRPSDIVYMNEVKDCIKHCIIVKTTEGTLWNISPKKHSIKSILKEIENED